MGHTRVVYFDELEKILNDVEYAIMDDKDADEKVKIAIQEFCYEFEKHMKQKMHQVYVRDVRQMKEKKPYFSS